MLKITLADTDALYCSKPTSSHQSGVFLGSFSEIGGLFPGTDINLEIDLEDILHNLVRHFVEEKAYYEKDGGGSSITLSQSWLAKQSADLDAAFTGRKSIVCKASLNVSTQKRVYLTGLVSLRDGAGVLKLKNMLFSGDDVYIYKANNVFKLRFFESASLGLAESEKPKDLLQLAIKLFASRRASEPTGTWKSYDEWTHGVREDFVKVDSSLLTDPAFDYLVFMRNFAISWQVANTKFAGHNGSEKCAVLDFLKLQYTNPQTASWYINPLNRVSVGGTNIKGMSPKAMLYFMSELHPEEFAAWTEPTYETLTFLGIHEGTIPKDLTISAYEDCKAKQHQIVAEMKKLGVGKATDDPSEPDFRTVNEFLWFVKENEKDIKTEVQKMKLTDPNPTAKNPGKKTWANVLSGKPDEMMNRLIAALLTKPFAILTGASGTGKSRMVRKLAYMTCLNTQLQPDPTKKKPIENFRMVQVKPNWHDSSELLGYRSAVSATSKYVSTDFVRFILKAHAFPETPFFVCLDEMNLAPVEHYFAEFLSASESARYEDGEWITDAIIDPGEFGGDINNLDPADYSIPSPRKELIEKIGLFIPHNLFVVGTVNMDDSTSGFSRKVLDRAMTLEMDDVNYEDLRKPSDLALFDETGPDGKVIVNGLLLSAKEIAAFISRCQFEPGKLDETFCGKLTKVKDKLHGTPLAVAHRFARECVQYREALQMLFAGKGVADFDEYAIDHMMLMKVLPRLEGNKDELGDLLGKLKDIFGLLPGHKISSEKFDKMEIAAGMNGGYFSFYL